jgi:predicted ATPase
MKIRKIKWANHPVLGDLEIDLINPTTSQPSDTIIFAGENGTGKTSILESISSFLNSGPFEFEFIEFSVGGDIFKAIPTSDGNEHKPFYDISDGNGVIQKIRSDKGTNPQLIASNAKDMRHYGCVFSKARADYKTQQIRSTTTKSLDVDKYDTDNEDDFTSLKQLLVDIQNQDNSDYSESNKARAEVNQPPMPWPKFYASSKIYRFKNSFDNFFDKLKYDRVNDINNEKVILFKKNGKTISIDKLSTGEKQIVFRGSYLLRNNRNLNGAAIMIDEPELSMHPKWQKSILTYYRNLFTINSIQNAQIFIATHSEYVLEEALSNRINNMVIVLKEAGGIISVKKIDAPSVLPTITSAETNYLAFDIVSNDYHIELYNWLQDKENKNTVKSCDDFIKNSTLYNLSIHHKSSSFRSTTYDTLSTYIRNAIHHPDPTRTLLKAN